MLHGYRISRPRTMPNSPELNTSTAQFCPKKDCRHYKCTQNKILKDGVYYTKNDRTERQMFKCVGGNHRFSETRYSELFGKHGSFKEYTQTAKLSQYGLSTEAIADVLEKDVRTIEVWQNGIADKSKRAHEFLCLSIILTLSFIQMDELWSFLSTKSRQLWVFAGIEVSTRFWINFELGSRTAHTATKLVNGIKRFLKYTPETPIKITTDKLAAYANAIENIFATTPYVYLQIVKKRFCKRLVTVKKCFVKGEAKDFLGKTQNTSFIERFNLTLRQRVPYLQRKTLGFCKKQANFKTSLWINLFSYNYMTHHKSLRVRIEGATTKKFQRLWIHRTPAMAQGLTNKPLTWRFLLTSPIPLTI